MRRQAAAVRPDQDELDLMTDECLEVLHSEAVLDTLQSATAARRNRLAVLVEERSRPPGQAAAKGLQRGQVDPDAFVADDAEVLRDRDTGLVDGEHMPDGARSEPWVCERIQATGRHGFRVD